jgi:pSer/pThr/pTyr-binding forkhead associated (FHA) protein
MQDQSISSDAGKISIHLLDPSSGTPINSWTFQNKVHISIGRAPDQDVAIGNPYVSRNHANIEHRAGSWLLISTGRNGVIVANEYVKELILENDLQFRMGVEGPTLKFSDRSEKSEFGATIDFPSELCPHFELDRNSLSRDVQEVEQGEYFQNLQRMAKLLRSQRNASEST